MKKTLPNKVSTSQPFFGPWVVRASFIMAVFGWGVGFYSPPIFLHEIVHNIQLPLTLVSVAVTTHYLFGAIMVTQLPALHRHFGVGPIATFGAVITAFGIVGWSVSSAPWHLFLSAFASGIGWVTMGAVAVNAAISQWYEKKRPMALAKAYNGSSIGGFIFSPLWVYLIATWGFTQGALIIGFLMVAVITVLSTAILIKTPHHLGQLRDGVDANGNGYDYETQNEKTPVKGLLFKNAQFVTLAIAMSTGLFAQIGLTAHLYSLLVPVFESQGAALTVSLATACAIAGRFAAAHLLVPGANPRPIAAITYGVQVTGSLILSCAIEDQTLQILVGVALIGLGMGNSSSLPPLIAQKEYNTSQVPRVVALLVAVSMSTYCLAPAAFGYILQESAAGVLRMGTGTTYFFLTIALLQGIALVSLLVGNSDVRVRKHHMNCTP